MCMCLLRLCTMPCNASCCCVLHTVRRPSKTFPSKRFNVRAHALAITFAESWYIGRLCSQRASDINISCVTELLLHQCVCVCVFLCRVCCRPCCPATDCWGCHACAMKCANCRMPFLALRGRRGAVVFEPSVEPARTQPTKTSVYVFLCLCLSPFL